MEERVRKLAKELLKDILNEVCEYAKDLLESLNDEGEEEADDFNGNLEEDSIEEELYEPPDDNYDSDNYDSGIGSSWTYEECRCDDPSPWDLDDPRCAEECEDYFQYD